MGADMPTKAPPYKAPTVSLYNWSGCYLGGNVGAGWSRAEWTATANTSFFGDLSPGQSFSQSNSGVVGGGQLGCNYQVNQWVFGIEGTFSGTSISGDFNDSAVLPGQEDIITHKIKFVATVVGRVGYAFNNWLPYIKGGYAGADVKFGVSDTVGVNQGGGSETHWHSGWTVGAGLEYGLTPNWIIGVEYNYIDLQTQSYNVQGAAAGIYTMDVKPRINEVLARISYKF